VPRRHNLSLLGLFRRKRSLQQQVNRDKIIIVVGIRVPRVVLRIRTDNRELVRLPTSGVKVLGGVSPLTKSEPYLTVSVNNNLEQTTPEESRGEEVATTIKVVKETTIAKTVATRIEATAGTRNETSFRGLWSVHPKHM